MNISHVEYWGPQKQWQEHVEKVLDGLDYALADDCFVAAETKTNGSFELQKFFYAPKFVSHVQFLVVKQSETREYYRKLLLYSTSRERRRI